MSGPAGPARRSTGSLTQSGPGGRVVAIDILRGCAILWVILYHLYQDLSLRFDRWGLFIDFRDHVFGGSAQAFTNLGEIFLNNGSLGVPMFMILSGLSLTMNAYRRGEPGVAHGYATRFRRILPVYWAGIVLSLATVAVIAALQVRLDGGSFREQWSLVGIARLPTQIGWRDTFWGFTVAGWVVRAGPSEPATVHSLWFVELILSYYLIFPFALRLERKLGPGLFAAAGIVLTLTARAVFVPWSQHALPYYQADNLLLWLAPLRMSEFFIGMSLGHLLVTRWDEIAGWTRSASDTTGLVAGGLALLLTGVLLAPHGNAALVASDVVIQGGLAVLMVPLLFKSPGRLEASAAARGLVFVGVVSFTALIVNDMMRYVASFLRLEGVHGAAWWFFLVVVYVPVGTLLAYPLAWVFRLLPSQRVRRPIEDLRQPAAASAPLRAEAAREATTPV